MNAVSLITLPEKHTARGGASSYLFGDSIDGGLNVGGGDHRHDRGINDTQVLHTVHQQIRTDNTAVFTPHHGGSATGMGECWNQGRPDCRSDVAVGGESRVRAGARGTKFLQSRRLVKLPDELDHLHKDVEIGRVRENTIVDYGVSPWISAVDVDCSTAEGLLEGNSQAGCSSESDFLHRNFARTQVIGEELGLTVVSLNDSRIGVFGEVISRLLALDRLHDADGGITGADFLKSVESDSVASANSVRTCPKPTLLIHIGQNKTDGFIIVYLVVLARRAPSSQRQI